MPLLTRVAAVALVSLVLTGCGGSDPSPTASAPQSPVASSSLPQSTPVLRAVLVETTKPIDVYAEPSGPVRTTLDPTTSYGSPRTFLVERVEGDWIRVFLPTRPNGATGWVAATDVTTQQITTSIVVNLTEHTITVTVPDHDPLTTPAAIGTPENPTPSGRFYVTDRVKPGDPDGAYGPLALGLSAHSDTLSEFGGGDGQIGIHGTNDLASIGKATSHGCIRVSPQVVDLLALVPLGTPVIIG
jgi:lipoprotein-anchoring transpeptidase ErfK/SrfK